MIRISVNLDRDGGLRNLQVKGHSELARMGEDVLCAAVSVLVQTAGSLFYSVKGIEVTGTGEKRGDLALYIQDVIPEKMEWFIGATDFLLNGFVNLERLYPKLVALEIAGESDVENR